MPSTASAPAAPENISTAPARASTALSTSVASGSGASAERRTKLAAIPDKPKMMKPIPTTTANAAVTESVTSVKNVATTTTRPTVTPEPDRKAASVSRSGRMWRRHSWKAVMSAPPSRIRPTSCRVVLEPPSGLTRKMRPTMAATMPSTSTMVHDVSALHGAPRPMSSSVRAVARSTLARVPDEAPVSLDGGVEVKLAPPVRTGQLQAS